MSWFCSASRRPRPLGHSSFANNRNFLEKTEGQVVSSDENVSGDEKADHLVGGPLVDERACSLALLGARPYSIFARSSSGVMGESSAGAMSKMVRQPVSPAQAMRQQARAQATSTLPVNSGLESSFSEYSITWVFSPSAPVVPVRMTEPPWGMPA